MARPSRPAVEEDDPALTPPGPYDPDPEAGPAEPWFVPAPPEPGASPADPPWHRTPRPAAAADWAAWEAAEAGRLAHAALAVGALDARVRHGSPGYRRRLVCTEAADLSWHLGERVTVDRLALYAALRLPAAGEDGRALARAAWAMRRLERAGPVDLDDPADLTGGGEAEPWAREAGEGLAPMAAGWRRELDAAAGLHPFTRAAVAWDAWRRHGLSGESAGIEGAVLAMRLGAAALPQGGLGLMPLGAGGPAALRPAGGGVARLAAWYDGIARAARQGLQACDRLDLWQRRAAARIAGMTGRTPPRLIAALVDWPLASAPMLETATGASRAAVQRNMARLEALELVHEVTGQARFRFWRAALPPAPRGRPGP